MKIELRRLTRPVRLRDYAEEYGDEVIYVWVNPSRAKRLELQTIGEASRQAQDRLKELLAQANTDEPDEELRQQIEAELTGITEEFDGLMATLYSWYAELWSQHPDAESHWTAEEVGELVRACQDADPALWSWIQDQSLQAVQEHRDGIKKKS